MATLNDIGYKKVFVSLDGSEQQDKVLSRAIVVAANNGAELYIGHVIDSTVLETAGAFPSDLIPGMDKAFRESIESLVAEAKANDHPEGRDSGKDRSHSRDPQGGAARRH